MPALAGLASGGVVAFAVWLSVSPSYTQIASSLRGQRPPLATEWEQIAASGDPKAIWAFAVRNSGTPESEQAHSKLVGLIDATVDIPTLQVLRLVAADAIAQRARDRLHWFTDLAAFRPGRLRSRTSTARSVASA